jgi:hypothetical protein
MPVKYAGLSVQTKAADMPSSREAAKAYVRDLADQLEVACRKHVGDVKPKGAPMFSMDGPVPDPSHSSLTLQGKPEYVYVFTYAVPVELDDLPVDCSAYLALKGGL